MVHEGGYSAAHVPFCALAVIETLSGIGTEVDDPFLAYAQRYGQQELQPHQDAQIAKAETLIAGVPTPPS